MPLPLFLGSFSGFEAGQPQDLQAFGMQPNKRLASQNVKETLVSAEMSEIRRGNGKLRGVT